MDDGHQIIVESFFVVILVKTGKSLVAHKSFLSVVVITHPSHG